jgi:maltooligosyltrehalose trehalohydrolase
MQIQDPFRRRPGVYYNANGTSGITVWAPLKNKVTLVATGESSFSLPLEKDEWGYWQLQTSRLKPGDLYRFSIEDEDPVPDPASVSQPQGIHGASEVLDRQFNWTDTGWKGIAKEDLVIYELHTGSFTGTHDFEGVIQRLPYLKELGITAIELMPVGQFPGDRNWGYDGVYPYAVQHSYGGLHGLKQLVNAAHEAGIAILLDVVYNHLGPDGNYLEAYGPYFTDKYKTPWGKALNFDSAWCDGVRHYFIQNALLWLEECRIDGLRMDAVHAIWDNSAYHFMQQLQDEVRTLEERTGRKKILVAEMDLNQPRYITGTDKGGYGLDAQWADEFHHALHGVLTGEQNGYYEDFGTLQQLEKAFRDSYVYDGVYSPHRKKMFGVPATGLPYSSFIVFSQNHDHIGNRVMGDRLTGSLSIAQLKLAAAFVLLSPHVPLLFMGEEYGERNPFLFFVHHSDPELVEIVRKGRREEFSYFNFKEDFPDPQAEETFGQSVLSWAQETNNEYADMLNWYKILIHLRKARPALRGTARSHMQVKPVHAQQKLLIAERSAGGERLVLLFSFSDTPQPLPSEYAALPVVLDSEGNNTAPEQLLPFSVTVLEAVKK